VSGPFETALLAQERIGWHSLLQGYWAKDWQLLYQQQYIPPEAKTNTAKSKRLTTMAHWQSNLIKLLWTHMIALWRLRRDERHGRDKQMKELAQHEVLTNELQLLYINRDACTPWCRIC
jgi:hypothetical protein